MEIYRQFGHISSEGHIHVYNRDEMMARAKQRPGTSIEILILERHGDMSHQQRKYYFSVLVPELAKAIAYHGTSMSHQEVDNMMREMFLSHEDHNEEDDTWTRTPRRLSAADTDVSVREFSQFVDNVIRWAIQELDWALPYPNEIFTFRDFTRSQIESLQKPHKSLIKPKSNGVQENQTDKSRI